MIIVSLVPLVFGPVLLASIVPAAPMTADEAVIVQHCLEEGASDAECACGLQAARELLTPAEMGIVAELAPSLSGEESVDAALLRAPEVMREKGLDFDAFLVVLDKVVQHAEIVEARCTDEAAG